MARGVGALNVSVNANTAQAIKNLRDFKNEARQTGQTAKEMAQSFQGNTIKDYENRFGPKSTEVKRSAAAASEFAHSMVDLRRDTDRYNASAMKQVTVIRQINGAMSQLKAVGKAAAVAFVAIEGFNFGQKIRGHIEYIHSWADAWRELKAAVTGTQSGYDIEMDKLTRQQERGEARIQKMQANLDAIAERAKQLEVDRAAAKANAQRERDVEVLGETEVRYRENYQKYGATTATLIQEDLDAAQTMREQKEKAEALDEARRKKEADHQANLRRDAEAIQELRERILDFGKTGLAAERDEMLRTIENAQQKAQARQHFATLERLEKDRDDLEGLKKERGTLASRTGQDDAFLDARTSEGWAALRNSTRNNPQLQKLDEQIAALERIEGLLGDGPVEEVVHF